MVYNKYDRGYRISGRFVSSGSDFSGYFGLGKQEQSNAIIHCKHTNIFKLRIYVSDILLYINACCYLLLIK